MKIKKILYYSVLLLWMYHGDSWDAQPFHAFEMEAFESLVIFCYLLWKMVNTVIYDILQPIVKYIISALFKFFFVDNYYFFFHCTLFAFITRIIHFITENYYGWMWVLSILFHFFYGYFWLTLLVIEVFPGDVIYM